MSTMIPCTKTPPRGAGGRNISRMLAFAALWPGLLRAAVIPEPDTVLYGRIINGGGATEHIVTSGTLTWNLQVPGGGVKSFQAKLEPLQGGMFSYQLRLPHVVLGLGLQGDANSLPLPIDQVAYVFGDIAVDGMKATVHPDHADALVVNQEGRAQARRVDLRLQAPMPDTDGDGMPDWWETAHGLDPLSAADAGLDFDGDGLSNLEEWRRGLSPEVDNRVPQLAWAEMNVYPVGTSGLPLWVVDTNTPPEEILLVVTRSPGTGELVLRGDAGERVLRRGDRISAAEAHGGRLLYRRDGGSGEALSATSFGVTLVDDAQVRAAIATPGWELSDEFLNGDLPRQEVALRMVRESIEIPAVGWQSLADSATPMPARSESAALRAQASILASRAQAVVWDVVDHVSGQRIDPGYGVGDDEDPMAQAVRILEPRQVLLGGTGDDWLTGGGGADVLYGGSGDDVLTGRGGPDRFVVGAGGGRVRIEDFRPEEGDQLDLTRLFRGKTGFADAYVRFVDGLPDGATAMEVFATPDQAGEPLSVITLASLALTADAFPRLAGQGALLLGDAVAQPMVTITSLNDGSENGLRPARFLIARVGGTGTPLSIHLSFSGSATPGVDYQLPAATAVIPAGASSVELAIQPYSDGQSETDEVVRVTVVGQPGYRVSLAEGAAEAAIRDLLPEFQMVALKREAAFDPWTAGQVRIRRDGLIDRQVVLELAWSGAAALGWLDPLPQYVEFGRGETTRLIEVRPRAGSARPDHPLSLNVRIVADSSYLLGDAAAAALTVVPSLGAFGSWAAVAFPDAGDPGALAQSDPDGRGFSALERFAFSLAPGQPDHRAASLPRIVERDGRRGIEFVVRPGAADLGVAVEASSHLRLWSGAAASVREVFAKPGESMPPGWRRFESPTAAAPAYFRVRLTLQP